MTLTYPACALVLLVGPSGSGKSTFAARHFGPSQIIASDQCREMIIDDAANQAINDDTFALLSHWLELRLKHRRFTVVDSTALKPGAREKLTRLAQRHRIPCYALALDVPLAECLRRDARRTGRQVGERVIRRHHAAFQDARRDLARDTALAGYHILSADDMETVVIEQGVSAENARRFDIIGDVHGCWEELRALWERLGYAWDERGLPRHPDGRVSVFVGDLADRGPDSPRVLRAVTRLIASGEALFVPGNHDDKLFRMLRGNKVTRAHGLDRTEAQLAALPSEERAALEGDILTYLAPQPPYQVLDGGRLIVAHAGIREEMIGRVDARVRTFTLYGDVRGFEKSGKPIRHDWAREYGGSALIAYGHTPQETLRWVNNTVNLDGGCVFGGFLAALRYPEREFVTVPARAAYAEHA